MRLLQALFLIGMLLLAGCTQEASTRTGSNQTPPPSAYPPQNQSGGLENSTLKEILQKSRDAMLSSEYRIIYAYDESGRPGSGEGAFVDVVSSGQDYLSRLCFKNYSENDSKDYFNPECNIVWNPKNGSNVLCGPQPVSWACLFCRNPSGCPEGGPHFMWSTISSSYEYNGTSGQWAETVSFEEAQGVILGMSRVLGRDCLNVSYRLSWDSDEEIKCIDTETYLVLYYQTQATETVATGSGSVEVPYTFAKKAVFFSLEPQGDAIKGVISGIYGNLDAACAKLREMVNEGSKSPNYYSSSCDYDS
ncbi:MAG: hypothetical protein AB1529_08145 [Candidatus Micrarchaeota archaeon]